jgi:polar amino acid transport system substrate-binding protein
MITPLVPERNRRQRAAKPVARRAAAIGSGLLLAVTAAACGSAAGSGTATAGGTFSYCSEITTPPAEFYTTTRVGRNELTIVPTGADIDIGQAVAKRLGAAASFSNMPFAGLITSLRAKKCDAIISFMNDTPQRRQLVSFVDYLAAGQSLLLRRGSPPIAGLDGLSGKTVAVLHGTTEESFLRDANRHLNGRPPIKVVPYPTDNEAIYALSQGKADAAFDDTPTVAYAAAHNKSLAEGVQLRSPIPIGIALRQGDPRIPKVESAIQAMEADGTMQAILARWGLLRFALKR